MKPSEIGQNNQTELSKRGWERPKSTVQFEIRRRRPKTDRPDRNHTKLSEISQSRGRQH